MLRGDHRRQLAHDQARHVREIAPALHQAGDPGEVALEPVLLLVGERRLPEVGDHRVDVVLELQDLARRIDVDLQVEVAAGDRGGHLGDGPYLPGQVPGHLVHRFGEVTPGAVHIPHPGLTAQLPLRAHLAGHPRDLLGERGQLVHHRVDGGLELQDLAPGVDVDLLGEVALGDRGGDHRDVADLPGQVGGHAVDGLRQVLPRTGDARHPRLTAEDPVRAHLAGDPGHLVRDRRQRLHHDVHGVGELRDLAARLDGDLPGQVAVGDRRRDLRDVPHLTGQVVGHQVDVVAQVLPDAGDVPHPRLTAELPFRADLACDPGDLLGEVRELVHHRVDGRHQLQDLALRVHGDLLRQIALGDRRRHLGDVADLRRQVVRHEVDGLRQVLPGAGDALHLGLPAEDALRTDLPRHPRHLIGERGQLVDHRVERVLQLQDLAPGVHVDRLGQVPARHRRGDLRDVTDLGGQVARHAVHGVGQVPPDARDARHLRLTAEPAVRTHLARYPRHLIGEGRELVDHRVDGVLQLQDLPAGIHVDLLREIAARDGRRHLRDLPHLRSEVPGHEVDRVGQLLPRAGHAVHPRLTAEPSLRAHVPRHPRDLVGERGQLVDHRVDGVLQLQHLAGDVDRDLLRQIAVRHRRRHLRDVADLTRQVAEGRVHRVGEVLPRARRARHLRLTAQLALDADLPRHPRHLGAERRELVHHRVDGVLQLQHLARDVDRDLLRQITVRHRRRHLRDVPHLRGDVAERVVHRVREVLPGPRRTRHLRLTAQQTVRADLARDARHLVGERTQRLGHLVDRFGQLRDLAARAHRDLLRQVAIGHSRRDLRDPPHLSGEISGHQVDRIRQVLPDPGHPRHLRLAAQLALGADLPRYPRHLGSEGRELVHHRIDGVLQLQHLPGHMNRDLPGEIPLRHRRRDESDVTHLSGEPGRHRVDGIREILPRTRHSTHPRLAAELALGTDLAGHPRHLVGERRQLVHEPVDRAPHLEELAAQRMRRPVGPLRAQIHPLFEIALGHRREHPPHLRHRPHQIVDQRVGGVDGRGPGPLTGPDLQPLREFALTPHHTPYARQLTRQLEIPVRHFIEHGGDLGHHPVARDRHTLPEVAIAHRRQRRQQPVQGRRLHFRRPIATGPSAFRARAHAPRRCARLHRVPPAGSTILIALPLQAFPVFHFSAPNRSAVGT